MRRTRILLASSLAATLAAATCGAAVTYERFGAVGDGRTDDRAAIVAAHAEANRTGEPVRAADGRTYYVGGGAESAVVQTDVDFGTAKFVIDDTAVSQISSPLFKVVPTRGRLALSGVTSLRRGQASLGTAPGVPCLVMAVNDKVRRYIRLGLNQNGGTAQQETFVVDAGGAIDPKSPIVWDYGEITSLTAYPIDARTLVIRGGVFTTVANRAESKYRYHNRGFDIRRSNVIVTGVRHEITGEGDHGAPYSGFLTIGQCANVTVTGCVFTAHRTYTTIGSAGKPVQMGSYDLTVNSSVNVSFIDCRQTTDILDKRYWGLFASNYSKNLSFDRCEFSRFDAHMGVANATIRNSRLGHMGINAIGSGTFLVENTTVLAGSFMNLRSDYGSTWDGDFIVRNCRFVPWGGQRKAAAALFGGQNAGQHDFGYVCHMPRKIVIDGLEIDDSSHPDSYAGPVIFANFNSARKDDSYVEKFPYRLTESVELRNVRTSSGKPLGLSFNPAMFKSVRVTRR